MKLCSACLMGVRCQYNGQGKPHKKVLELMTREVLIPVCPEQYGGLPIPREPAERQGDRVVSRDGRDVTAQFEKGAHETLRLARLYGITEAILKQRSPSCGSGQIYDGSYSGRVVPGDGLAAALLKQNGVRIVSEEDL
jgi:Uncharacterized conserved protein